MYIANIFSWCINCFSNPVQVVSWKTKTLLFLIESNLFIFYILANAFCVLRHPSLPQGMKDIHIYFLLSILKFCFWHFKSLIHSQEEGIWFNLVPLGNHFFQFHVGTNPLSPLVECMLFIMFPRPTLYNSASELSVVLHWSACPSLNCVVAWTTRAWTTIATK